MMMQSSSPSSPDIGGTVGKGKNADGTSGGGAIRGDGGALTTTAEHGRVHNGNGKGGVVDEEEALLIPVGHNVGDDVSTTKKRSKSLGRATDVGAGGGGGSSGKQQGYQGGRAAKRGTTRSRRDREKDNAAAKFIKYAALFLLVAQMVGLVLLMRYSRTRPRAPDQPLYLASTAVFYMEVMKLVICLAVIAWQAGGCAGFAREVRQHVLESPGEVCRLTVPSLLYTVQNNLLYLALTNLDAATYQVCYQLKILTTALFSAILLHRKFSPKKWTALVLLTVGVAIVQVSGSGDQHTHAAAAAAAAASSDHQDHPIAVAGAAAEGDAAGDGDAAAALGEVEGGDDTEHRHRLLQAVVGEAAKAAAYRNHRWIGLIAVLCAACTSGFSGVYFEKILKGSRTSLWIRNVQMGLSSVVIAYVTALLKDGPALRSAGWLQGYNGTVWTVVTVQAVGGLIVATVVKYADNVLKVFATSFSIVVSCIISAFLFDFHPTYSFLVGASLVVASTVMYSQPDASAGGRKRRKTSSVLPVTHPNNTAPSARK